MRNSSLKNVGVVPMRVTVSKGSLLAYSSLFLFDIFVDFVYQIYIQDMEPI